MPRAASKLRDRVKFQRRVLTADGFGNREGDWADLEIERACELIPTRGGETIQAARLTGSTLWDCWVRRDRDTITITTGDRAVDVRDPSRVFNVRFNEDMDGRNAWRLIQLESGVADG